MTNTAVHVGSGGSKHKLRRLLLGVGAVVLVAAIATAAGVGVRWWQQQREYNRLSKPETIAEEATTAQNQAITGDFYKAHQTINEALDNPKLSASAKHDLYLQEGVTYENEKNYDAAMESYRKAEAAKESQEVAQSIARLAELKGDKETAIAYYRKAITLVPDDDTMSASTKKYYENKITVLEGGQPDYD